MEPQGIQPQYPPAPPQTNGKSIAALVLGILSVIIPYVGFILGILAIIFGKLSLNEVKRRGDGGKGLAVAGLVCGIIGTAIYALIILIAVIGLISYYSVSDGI